MEDSEMYGKMPVVNIHREYHHDTFLPYDLSLATGHKAYPMEDPGTHRTPGGYLTDTSVRLDNMRRYLAGLDSFAYGDQSSVERPFPDGQECAGLDSLDEYWDGGFDALESMRYMSPNGPWGGSLSSTNSATSDSAFSPTLERSRTALLHDEVDFNPPMCESHYDLSGAPPHSLYLEQASISGPLAASPVETEPTMGCSMREIQPGPDLHEEDMVSGAVVHPAGVEERSYPSQECWGSGSLGLNNIGDEDFKMGHMVEKDDLEPHKQLPSASAPAQPITPLLGQAPTPTQSPIIPQSIILRSNTATNRIAKQPKPTVATKTKKKPRMRKNGGNKKGDSRPFVCVFSHYGCASCFTSKNEWKRHVASKHLQLGFYRCDTGQCNPFSSETAKASRYGSGRNESEHYDHDDPSHQNSADQPLVKAQLTFNDFNRKDLFTQHHRRMHTPWPSSQAAPSGKAHDEFERGLEQVRTRCWRQIRDPPRQSQCIFCSAKFHGDGSWEDRMEHIGRHFEHAERDRQSIGSGREDPDLRMWALQEGIVIGDPSSGGYRLDGEHRSREPMTQNSAPRNVSASRGRLAVGGTAMASLPAFEEEDALGDEE